MFQRREAFMRKARQLMPCSYIQKGTVRLTVVSKSGKEATIAILNPGDFCGEGCLTGQPLRLGPRPR